MVDKQMNDAQILRLDKTGFPISWVTAENAALFIMNERVLWSLGEKASLLKGGVNNLGIRSELGVPSIIATDGRDKGSNDTPPLTNHFLFRRDAYTCMYCGQIYDKKKLSRDHIFPASKGGRNIWSNCITSCIPCNNRKRDRTPEQAGMKLLSIPFVPSRQEFLYLANRNILGDQMDYLKKGIRPQFMPVAA